MKLLSRGIAQKQAHHKLFVQGSETSHHWLIEKKKKNVKIGGGIPKCITYTAHFFNFTFLFKF